MKQQFTIQISQKITVSKVIQAETFEDAIDIAKRFIDNSDEFPLVKPANRQWTEELKDEAQIVGIFV
jgi:hypothetical protein